jgi:hypothetical protein
MTEPMLDGFDGRFWGVEPRLRECLGGIPDPMARPVQADKWVEVHVR